MEETKTEGMLHIWAAIGTSYTILVEDLKAKRRIILRLVLKKYELASVAQQKYCLYAANPLFSLLLGPVMLLL